MSAACRSVQAQERALHLVHVARSSIAIWLQVLAGCESIDDDFVPELQVPMRAVVELIAEAKDCVHNVRDDAKWGHASAMNLLYAESFAFMVEQSLWLCMTDDTKSPPAVGDLSAVVGQLMAYLIEVEKAWPPPAAPGPDATGENCPPKPH